MNIFYLHPAAPMSAGLHADIHVGKMLVESAQLLCTAHHMMGSEAPYKKSHQHGRFALWVRESPMHYRWLWELARQLGRENMKRTGKRHKTEEILPLIEALPPELAKLPATWSPPPLSEDAKTFWDGDHISTMRKFYLSKRERMKLVWNGSPIVPLFLTQTQ